MYQVDNAVIMAAGTSSRFAPLSYERPKALIEVKGEILIERQIRQLQEAGIRKICIVTGYKAECFGYLEGKFGVELRYNMDYNTRNNNASIYVVRDLLHNTYVCSADNYFSKNPFEPFVKDSYYAGVFAKGETKEWCMEEDDRENICRVTVGGKSAWYMLGHTFWNEEFSKSFVKILEEEYAFPETADKLWESIYMEHLGDLKMKIRKYPQGEIFEFDTLDELRDFDTSYIENTRSAILKDIACRLHVSEERIKEIRAMKGKDNEAIGFSFRIENIRYQYQYENQILKEEED